MPPFVVHDHARLGKVNHAALSDGVVVRIWHVADGLAVYVGHLCVQGPEVAAVGCVVLGLRRTAPVKAVEDGGPPVADNHGIPTVLNEEVEPNSNHKEHDHLVGNFEHLLHLLQQINDDWRAAVVF